jgi:multidrug efflux pump subunit AcrA (membrane-fusion protein)
VLSRSQAEVARARDELQRAEQSRNIAHLSYTRLADVAKQKAGLVAQQEIDDAQSKDLVAEAQVSAARSSLSAAEQQVQVSTAELQKVKTLLDYTRVTAPFTGVVTKRYADTGSMIPAGTSSSTQVMPLVKLSQNSLLRLVLPVPESAVPTVHIGQQVEVRVPTLGRSFPGKVIRFSDKIAMATRTMDTEVDVENPSLILIPGMFAEVNLTLDHRAAVLRPGYGGDARQPRCDPQCAVGTPDRGQRGDPFRFAGRRSGGYQQPDQPARRSGRPSQISGYGGQSRQLKFLCRVLLFGLLTSLLLSV